MSPFFSCVAVNSLFCSFCIILYISFSKLYKSWSMRSSTYAVCSLAIAFLYCLHFVWLLGHSGSWDGLCQEISKLVAVAGGIWGGAAGGAAGYTLTFAIAYLRDFGLDYRILSESLETMVPWSVLLCIRLVLKKSLKIFEHLLSRWLTKTDSTCVFFCSLILSVPCPKLRRKFQVN